MFEKCCSLCRYSQNILKLREQVDDTQRQVASLGGEPRQADPLRVEHVRELHGQLGTLRAKMHRMETLEKSFSKRQLEVRAFMELLSYMEYASPTVESSLSVQQYRCVGGHVMQRS